MSGENNPRIAIGEELRKNWRAENAGGYELAPNWEPGDDQDGAIGLMLGFFDEDLPKPQLALTDVSSTAAGNNGRVGWKPDGSGFIQRYDGRVDANILTGTVDDVEGPPGPGVIAEDIGNEVRDILHDAVGLDDPATGELLCSSVTPLSRPDVNESADGPMASYRATVEIQYRLFEQPPER